MLRSYLVTALRSLARHRLHALVNLAGLSLGMAFCALAWLYASTEWSFDRFHRDAERIFRVYAEGVAGNGERFLSADLIPVGLAPAVADASPEVERAVRLVSRRSGSGGNPYLRVTRGQEGSDEPYLLADPEFFDLFDFPLERGEARTALTERRSVVLSHELAQRWFGDADPVGHELSIHSRARGTDQVHRITGVAAPLPRHSSIRFNLVLPYENVDFLYGWEPDAWEHTCNAYVRLARGASAEDVAPELQALWRTHMMPDDAAQDTWHVRLQPLTGLRHDTSFSRWIGHGTVPPVDPAASYLLAAIALGVLALAAINFVNLSLGRADTRLAEIGVRRAVGAERPQLIGQFLGEALVLSLIGLAAGIALAEAALPAFNAFAGRALSLDLTEPATVAALGVLVLAVTVAAGVYPALVLSGLRPLSALQRRTSVTGPGRLTRGLLAFQLALSIGLVTCTLVMRGQMRHLTRDVGFEGEHVLLVDTDALHEGNPLHPRLMEAFAAHSGVAHVSSMRYTYGLLDDVPNRERARTDDGRELETQCFFVDPGFVSTLGLELVAGRDFDRGREDGGVAIVSEGFVRRMGWREPLGQELTLAGSAGRLLRKSDGRAHVVGVVRDFTLRSSQAPATPALILINPSLGPDLYEARAILVRVRPGAGPAVLEHVRKTWAEVVDYADFRHTYLQENVDRYLRDERRWQQLVTWAAACAILIASLGAFALTALAVTRRTKEIGVRKVLGATSAEIAGMLSRELGLLGVVGAVLAWPVAWWIMGRWLGGFAYRIEPGPAYFLSGAVVALAAVGAAVTVQMLRAARTRPVDALRYE